MTQTYDTIGTGYRATRRADPRIGAAIERTLPRGASVLNVGAGTGSYEPSWPNVVALEPSAAMIAQRAELSAPAARGVAEALPFRARSFDAVLGVLTLHHWRDLAAGLAECQRVARKQVVLFTWDPESADFWLNDYFPDFYRQARRAFPTMATLQQLLGPIECTRVPLPADCHDGFLGAYWRRPSAYLDARVRAGISSFALRPDTAKPLAELEADLQSGEWNRRYGAVSALDELDLGYRVVVARVG